MLYLLSRKMSDVEVTNDNPPTSLDPPDTTPSTNNLKRPPVPQTSVDTDDGDQPQTQETNLPTEGGEDSKDVTHTISPLYTSHPPPPGPPDTPSPSPVYTEARARCLRTGSLWDDPEFPARNKSISPYSDSPGDWLWKRPGVRNIIYQYIHNNFRFIGGLYVNIYINM